MYSKSQRKIALNESSHVDVRMSRLYTGAYTRSIPNFQSVGAVLG